MLKCKKENLMTSHFIYTPVHFVVTVGNCGLCKRRCLASSSYVHAVHFTFVIMHTICYDASTKH